MYEMTVKFGVFDGIQRTYTFLNGYKASVICHSCSHGGKYGLWELMLTRNGTTMMLNDDKGVIVEEDVTGWLSDAQLADMIRSIASLPNPDQ